MTHQRTKQGRGAPGLRRRVHPARWTLGALLALSLFLAACTGFAGDSWAGVTIDDEQRTVYVAYDDEVMALDTSDGAIIWKYPPDKDTKFYADPTIDDGSLYVGDWEGRLHSIDLETGSANWIYEPEKDNLIGPLSLTPDDRIISGVAFDSNMVYFGLASHDVVAVSRETAEERWRFGTDHGVWSTPLLVPANDDDPDSVATLYVVSLDHNLYALDPATGDERWRKDLGGAAPGDMLYDPLLNRVYVGTLLSELIAIDLAEREIVLRYETEGWLWGRPALEVDEESGVETLYFGDLDGFLYAVRITEDGFEEIWKRQVAEDAIRSTPLITDELILAGSQDKHLYAVSKANGSEVWNDDLDGEVLSELVLVPEALLEEESETRQDLVIFSTEESDERVVAYVIESGERDWHYSD